MRSFIVYKECFCSMFLAGKKDLKIMFIEQYLLNKNFCFNHSCHLKAIYQIMNTFFLLVIISFLLCLWQILRYYAQFVLVFNKYSFFLFYCPESQKHASDSCERTNVQNIRDATETFGGPNISPDDGEIGPPNPS